MRGINIDKKEPFKDIFGGARPLRSWSSLFFSVSIRNESHTHTDWHTGTDSPYSVQSGYPFLYFVFLDYISVCSVARNIIVVVIAIQSHTGWADVI